MLTQCTPKEEKLHLCHRGMVGYVRLDQTREWDGHLFQRLARALKAAAKQGGEVMLVRSNGECFHQNDGVATDRVYRGGYPMSVCLHQRLRRRSTSSPKPASTSGRPARPLPENHRWHAVTANRYRFLDQ